MDPQRGEVKLSQLLPPRHIRLGVEVQTKKGAIEEALSLLRKHPAVLSFEDAAQAIILREELMSTGVGHGIGLPHAKTTAVTTTVATLITLQEAVDFAAIDAEPVRIVFLLLSPPTTQGPHIRILSRISRMLHHDPFRASLLQARKAKEVARMLTAYERTLIDQVKPTES